MRIVPSRGTGRPLRSGCPSLRGGRLGGQLKQCAPLGVATQLYHSHETERGEAVGGASAGGSTRVQNPKGSVTSDHVLLRTVRAVRPVPAGRMAREGFELGVWNVRTLRGRVNWLLWSWI